MQKLLSPGIKINEIYQRVEPIAQPERYTYSAYIGNFPWGPVNDPTLIRNINELNSRFKLGTSAKAIRSYLGAYNYFSYGDGLMNLTRLKTNSDVNAVALLPEHNYDRYITRLNENGEVGTPEAQTKVNAILSEDITDRTVTIKVDDVSGVEVDSLLFKNLNSNYLEKQFDRESIQTIKPSSEYVGDTFDFIDEHFSKENKLRILDPQYDFDNFNPVTKADVEDGVQMNLGEKFLTYNGKMDTYSGRIITINNNADKDGILLVEYEKIKAPTVKDISLDNPLINNATLLANDMIDSEVGDDDNPTLDNLSDIFTTHLDTATEILGLNLTTQDYSDDINDILDKHSKWKIVDDIMDDVNGITSTIELLSNGTTYDVKNGITKTILEELGKKFTTNYTSFKNIKNAVSFAEKYTFNADTITDRGKIYNTLNPTPFARDEIKQILGSFTGTSLYESDNYKTIISKFQIYATAAYISGIHAGKEKLQFKEFIRVLNAANKQEPLDPDHFNITAFNNFAKKYLKDVNRKVKLKVLNAAKTTDTTDKADKSDMTALMNAYIDTFKDKILIEGTSYKNLVNAIKDYKSIVNEVYTQYDSILTEVDKYELLEPLSSSSALYYFDPPNRAGIINHFTNLNHYKGVVTSTSSYLDAIEPQNIDTTFKNIFIAATSEYSNINGLANVYDNTDISDKLKTELNSYKSDAVTEFQNYETFLNELKYGKNSDIAGTYNNSNFSSYKDLLNDIKIPSIPNTYTFFNLNSFKKKLDELYDVFVEIMQIYINYDKWGDDLKKLRKYRTQLKQNLKDQIDKLDIDLTSVLTSVDDDEKLKKLIDNSVAFRKYTDYVIAKNTLETIKDVLEPTKLGTGTNFVKNFKDFLTTPTTTSPTTTNTIGYFTSQYNITKTHLENLYQEIYIKEKKDHISTNDLAILDSTKSSYWFKIALRQGIYKKDSAETGSVVVGGDTETFTLNRSALFNVTKVNVGKTANHEFKSTKDKPDAISKIELDKIHNGLHEYLYPANDDFDIFKSELKFDKFTISLEVAGKSGDKDVIKLTNYIKQYKYYKNLSTTFKYKEKVKSQISYSATQSVSKDIKIDSQSIDVTNPVTVSVYVKSSDTKTFPAVAIRASIENKVIKQREKNAIAIFDLIKSVDNTYDKSVDPISGGCVITTDGDFKRCSYTFKMPGATSYKNLQIQVYPLNSDMLTDLSNPDKGIIYTLETLWDGFEGVKGKNFTIKSAQVEQNPAATSYRKYDKEQSYRFVGYVTSRNITTNNITYKLPDYTPPHLKDEMTVYNHDRLYSENISDLVQSVEIPNEKEFENFTNDVFEICARYPGTFGESLKVIIHSGSTKTLEEEKDAEWNKFSPYRTLSKFGNKRPTTTLFVKNKQRLDKDKWGENDQIYVIVVDQNGRFSGKVGSVLESFNLSKASDAVDETGESLYYKKYINKYSNYIYILNTPNKSNWGKPRKDIVSYEMFGIETHLLKMGDEGISNERHIKSAIDLYRNEKQVPVDIFTTAGIPFNYEDEDEVKDIYRYINDNIIDYRRDCVMTISPPHYTSNILENTIKFYKGEYNEEYGRYINGLDIDSSYVIADSGWKMQLNPYTNETVWVPLNADVSGLLSQVDSTHKPWYSPAGYSRGSIKNCLKLSWNPTQDDRDILYPNLINPVITEVGFGSLLFGDKTYTDIDTGFDRINVRRLFLKLQKNIKLYARDNLFNFNDKYARDSFRNSVNEYLNTVKSDRGIIDYVVVCDETNNTPDIINQSGFVADIYIKPNHVVNYITLSFINTPTGIEFAVA